MHGSPGEKKMEVEGGGARPTGRECSTLNTPKLGAGGHTPSQPDKITVRWVGGGVPLGGWPCPCGWGKHWAAGPCCPRGEEGGALLRLPPGNEDGGRRKSSPGCKACSPSPPPPEYAHSHPFGSPSLTVHTSTPPRFHPSHSRPSRFQPEQPSQFLMRCDELGLPDTSISKSAASCGYTYAFKMLLEDATGQVGGLGAEGGGIGEGTR